VKTHPEAVVALHAVEIEIRPAGGDFARVVEHRGINEPVDHDAPFGLKDQTVLVAEAVAAESAQRGSTAHRGQHEKRDLLIALVQRRLGQPAERDDPGFAQDWKVLDYLVVELTEAEFLIAVGVIVQRDAVEPSAPGIAFCAAPVEAGGALGM
jgi:hypothetical protein